MSLVPTARELFISRRRLSAEDERNFFNSLRLRNRTFKTTTVGRLDDLNHLLLPLLPAARPLKTMDVAVSSGVTTVEWSRALTAAGITHRMMASDLMLSSFLISLGRYLHVLVDKTGYPLQFDFWGRAVPNPVIRRRDRLYRPLIVYVESQLGRHFASLARNCERAPEDEGVREGRLACRHITLVSPSVGKPAHIEFVEDDIQQNEGPRGCFHVVRAANILNQGYFSDQALIVMIANLRARLQAGGLLAVCRTTNDGINLATVFRLVETGRLDIVARLGAGSEVESLALSLPPL